MRVSFSWCKEARDEFNDAVSLPGGSELKGETVAKLKQMVNGKLDLTGTHKLIRAAEVGDWTILYTGGDGAYVGLLFVRSARDQLPPEAHQLARSRLANLRC